LSCSGRVVSVGGADSMLQFQLKSGRDGTKHCQKMKLRQRAHFGSMERKRDMVRRCGDVGQRRAYIGEG
jgi:hypothetical protein